jgi:hypothetical protein
VTKTSALETLVIASFVRGLPVRGMEAAPAEALGDQAAISKSTVSAICGQIKGEYQARATRLLDDVVLDYLFLDASFFRMHPGSPAGPVLTAWGITTGGKPAFIGLAPGSGESADAWHEILADLKDPRPALPAARHLRRPRPDRRGQAGLPQGAAPALSHPPRQKCPGQGPGRDAGRGQGRLLAALRHRGPEDPARFRLVELTGARISEMAGRYAATYRRR